MYTWKMINVCITQYIQGFFIPSVLRCPYISRYIIELWTFFFVLLFLMNGVLVNIKLNVTGKKLLNEAYMTDNLSIWYDWNDWTHPDQTIIIIIFLYTSTGVFFFKFDFNLSKKNIYNSGILCGTHTTMSTIGLNKYVSVKILRWRLLYLRLL